MIRREFITLLGGARSSLQGLLLFTPKSPAAPRNHLVLVLPGPSFHTIEPQFVRMLGNSWGTEMMGVLDA
jgi:hypothetical protein